MELKKVRAWAFEEFGAAQLGDARRTARLVSMAARAAERPGGRVSGVFKSDAERQGAYDFLEAKGVDARAIGEATFAATAKRAKELARVVVAIDGSSLSLTNYGGKKDFGRLGSYRGKAAERGGNGLKVISSLGIDPMGAPLGLVDQQWWVRLDDPNRAAARAPQKRERVRRTPCAQKETQRWLDAIAATEQRFKQEEVGAHRCYVLDREADAGPILMALAETKQDFIVRASWDRRLEPTERGSKNRVYLRAVVDEMAILGGYSLDITAGPARVARRAKMAVSAGTVTLQLRHPHRRKRVERLTLQVVRARELGTTPPGEKPIDWMLLTTLPVVNFDQARDVVRTYALRWRIEDFHRTWKSGTCEVEAMQLRSAAAAMRWATVLAAVAARTERLKHLARTQPDEPASIVLSKAEIRVLIVLKRNQKKKTETVADTMPTIGQATLWIAELGGYTGKSSGGPPGSVTIGRGLETVRAGAELMLLLSAADK